MAWAHSAGDSAAWAEEVAVLGEALVASGADAVAEEAEERGGETRSRCGVRNAGRKWRMIEEGEG